MTLEEKIKTLPDDPGIYLMKNKDGKIIYVGKAKVLKNRVRQYFQPSKNHPPKVAAMVSNIADFEYIVTRTELEAFALEFNYIKKYKPYYSILLKDDKAYPYIKVTLQNDYPQIFLCRRVEKDGAKYFGPYTDAYLVRETISMMKKIFKIQYCKKNFPGDIGKERPCLYYSMGRCLAPCQGLVSQQEYKQAFVNICNFLKGNHQSLLNQLTEEMNQAAGALNFERAAMLRNQISALRRLSDKQRVISTNLRDFDVVGLCRQDDDAAFVVFHIQMGKLAGNESFNLSGTTDIDDEILMNDFLNQYYQSHPVIPTEVLISHPATEQNTLQAFLTDRRQKKVTVRCPVRGEGKSLCDMAIKNARKNLDNYRLDKLKAFQKQNVLGELKDALALPTLPRRIEAYDISNISGAENVGGMIVFQNAKPVKRDYRRFKIKYTTGANDYDCMREVLYRRFAHALREQQSLAEEGMDADDAKFALLPDLVLIDGGKSHAALAQQILDEFGLDLPVFGMVKDDRHRTRGVVNALGEANLKPQSAAFRLITHIQDEVHNYAITYHRLLRSKKSISSSLENIKGVGEVKRKKLLGHFKSMAKIKEASLDELKEVVDEKTAQNIFDYFHNRLE